MVEVDVELVVVASVLEVVVDRSVVVVDVLEVVAAVVSVTLGSSRTSEVVAAEPGSPEHAAATSVDAARHAATSALRRLAIRSDHTKRRSGEG